MNFQFLGRRPYADAVLAQREGTVLGFDPEKTISIGMRGAVDRDITWPLERWHSEGYVLYKADRGGQVTLHNPGQLVIFPTLDVRPFGVRGFICLLKTTTENFLKSEGLEVFWREAEPGLYSERGKVVSFGVRIKAGVAHHGMAINVHNDLSAFAGIRVCGRAGGAMDGLRSKKNLEELFLNWGREFTAQLTSRAFSRNLGADQPCAPSSVG